ncbi:MAG: flagellar biosynthesis protein FliQ [Candidatus Eremiobacteraeota bacterium]|nr:flagellar biosynthesis protein FliQ [Candidatus Eremiobacteraeota bacterium]
MSEEYVLYVCGQALYLIMILSAPMLVSALVVGLVISVLQATTQVQEQTLSFVPKIIATFVAVLVAGSWIAQMLGRFALEVFKSIPNISQVR